MRMQHSFALAGHSIAHIDLLHDYSKMAPSFGHVQPLSRAHSFAGRLDFTHHLLLGQESL